ncbi:MAG: diaminopimelate epimerase [Bryobacter sp.]|nr:diaminopimelate epimerase [Bryobacter sp.]
MNIPFVKAHGARNDFLLSWLPDHASAPWLSRLAIAICDRHSGIGADGWYLMSPPSNDQPAHLRIRLFNPDGGEVEMSGNGTRCAAAYALAHGLAAGPDVTIATGSGPKHVTLLARQGNLFHFRMNMGAPKIIDPRTTLEALGQSWDATLVDVGNPQCAVFVEHFDFDWPAVGAALEHHPRFPQRTNVSFVKPSSDDNLSGHAIDVRFFERGAGITNSSGTGSTGAMVASVLRKLVSPPVQVNTVAGPLQLSGQETIYLEGPAELTADGVFFFDV